MAEQDALVVVLSRNAFYKRLHYLAIGVFVWCLLVISVLLWGVIYIINNPFHPLYFATDNVGRLIRIISVEAPNMTADDVVKWSIDAVEASYSYDYINYRAQIQDAQKYFTNYGWTNYVGALRASNNLLALTQRKMVAMAQVVGKPKLLVEGLLSGAYAWKYQMPVLVTYSYPPYDDKSRFSNPLEVTVIVQRQPPLEGYKGLGVVQMIGRFVASSSNQPQEISGTETGS